jgi:MFS family permease
VSDDGAAEGIAQELKSSGQAFVHSFRSPSIARAQIGLVAFSLTEWGAYIAIVVYAYDRGGAPLVGAISLAQLIPSALVAPVESTLGDRYRRERVLLWSYVALSFFTGLAALAMLADAPALVVFVTSSIAAWLTPLVRPTHGALLPWISRTPEELTVAYAASGVIASVSVLVGPLLAAVVLGMATGSNLSGPGLVYGVLGAMLAVGAILAAGIRPEAEEDLGPEEQASGFVQEMLAGFRLVRRDRRPRRVIGFIGLQWISFGMIDTLIVVLALDVLGSGDASVGVLNAAMGVGAIVGATVSVVIAARARLFPWFRGGILLQGIPLAGIAAAPSILVGPGLALAGLGGALTDTTGTVMLQRLVPDRKLTRVFGVLESVYMGAEGLGAFLGAMLVVTFGPGWTLVAAGLITPAVGFIYRRRLGELDVGVRVPVHEMELLRQTDIFAPVPAPALERIASNSVPVHAAAGSVLIREGDDGDLFYVISEGRASVLREGVQVAELGPGEFFGEIALLRDVPRTATVAAKTEIGLLTLEREEFLRAITGHEETGHVAHRVADERRPRTEPER